MSGKGTAKRLCLKEKEESARPFLLSTTDGDEDPVRCTLAACNLTGRESSFGEHEEQLNLLGDVRTEMINLTRREICKARRTPRGRSGREEQSKDVLRRDTDWVTTNGDCQC